MNLIPTLEYAWLTLKHKAYVFRAGLRTNAPIWRLIIHDWSKFTPSELPHYGRQFFGDRSQPHAFAAAWLHHQNANPHHWEYWISRKQHDRNGGGWAESILPMPEWAVREMIADWMGAGRAYSGSWPVNVRDWKWLNENWPKIRPRLHAMTALRVELVLSELFDPIEVLNLMSEQGSSIPSGSAPI